MAARTPLSHGTPMTASFSYFRRPPHVMAAAVVALALSAAPAFAQVALTPELEAAVQAVQRATQADADQYAPAELAAARQSLAQAQAAHASREKKTGPLFRPETDCNAEIGGKGRRIRRAEFRARAAMHARRCSP